MSFFAGTRFGKRNYGQHAGI